MTDGILKAQAESSLRVVKEHTFLFRIVKTYQMNVIVERKGLKKGLIEVKHIKRNMLFCCYEQNSKQVEQSDKNYNIKCRLISFLWDLVQCLTDLTSGKIKTGNILNVWLLFYTKSFISR